MKSHTRWIAAILALAGIAALATWDALRKEKTIRGLETALASARQEAVTLRQQMAPTSSALASPQGTQGVPTQTTPDAKSEAAAQAEPPLDIHHPGVQPLSRSQRLRVIGSYSDILVQLKLSPEKLAALSKLLIEKYTARADVGAASSKAGLGTHTPEWNIAVAAADAPSQTAIKNLLGEETFAQFQALNQTVLDRQATASIVSSMSDSGVVGFMIEAGAPLTNEQLNSMAVIHRRLLDQGKMQSGDEADPATGLLPGHAALLTEASPLLSSDQVAALRQFYVQFARPPP